MNKKEIKRPSWDETFIKTAIEISKRSHDAQTQVGAILVAQTNEVISAGYNGYVRNIKDEILPNLRPDKYPWMIHAEHNAVLNCARQGISTLNTRAYITCKPCLYCLQYMYQSGVKEIIYAEISPVHMVDNDKKYDSNITTFLKLTEDKFTLRKFQKT